MKLIYLLHFDNPYHHARHYCGMTRNLHRRLTSHAQGRAARLTRALFHKALGWQLAATGITRQSSLAAQIERRTKDSHHLARYCPICTKNPLAFPGCIMYDLTLLPFPIQSEHLQ